VPAKKIPFIISVTGHRDLSADEITRCRKKVKTTLKYFCDLKKLKGTPVWIFSSLADGADRCVAEVAITLRETGLYDIRLIAPLPLEREDYIQDFSESSVREFDHLLNQMDDYFVLDPYEYEGFNLRYLSLPELNNRKEENNWGYSAERNAQYVNLGAFLVRHANILLALWDGNIATNATGGTSEVVKAMLNQPLDWGKDRDGNSIPPREELKESQTLMGGESGAVIHIPVKRNHPGKNVSILQLENQRPKWASHWPNDTIKWYFSSGLTNNKGLSSLIYRSQNELSMIINKISEFNFELAKITANRPSDQIEEQLEKSWIQPANYNFSHAVKLIRNCYKSADLCALSMQVKAKRLILTFFFCILITVIGYDVFNRVGPSGTQLGFYSLLLFLTGILLVSGTYVYSRKMGFERNFHDFRVYSELMRVSSYLSYLGINRKIIDFFSPETRSMTAWLEHARRAAEYQTWDREFTGSPCSTEAMSNIKEWWLNDQLAYYESKLGNAADKNKKINLISRQNRIKIISSMLYLIGAGVITYIAFYYFMGKTDIADYIWLNAVFFGSSAAVLKWGEIQGYKDDAARYTLARDMYQWAAIEFDYLLVSNDLPRLNGVILELSKQAISENTRWYISQNARNARKLR